MLKIRAFVLLFFATSAFIYAQQNATIYGKITDETGDVVPGGNIYLVEKPSAGTVSDEDGNYMISVPSGKDIEVVFSFIGLESDTQILNLKSNQKRELNIVLNAGLVNLKTIEITTKDAVRTEASGVLIEVKDIEKLPVPFASIEAALASQALGVSATNELSTTYSVRGGNFDENLVYVNDFEIFRPFLIRSGQQEGLSFINVDMVNSVFFSSGGFQAKYGDKMASVLDVQYKRPKEFKGSVEIGLLGGSLHLEGSDKKDKFTYLLGVRQKSSQYLLRSLETQGQYSPSFTDVQSFFTYKISEKTDIEWISNFAMNRFVFVPVNRETTFGVVNNVLRLTVFFDGKEDDRYRTLMTGFGVNQRLNKNLGFKWLTSVYRSRESEAYDIIGEYWLDEVETDFSRDNFGQSRFSLGVGGIQQFARNDLEAIVANAGYRGYFIKNNHNIKWGLTYQHEIIDDRLNEWERIDSAGYSLPYTGNEVSVSSVLKTRINLNSNRIHGFFQDSWMLDKNDRMSISYGVRFTYWDVNKEWVFSPRFQFSYKPDTRADIVLRAAAGLYAQPPFYREMRDLDGVVNTKLKAQKSVHAVAGIDMNFLAWERRFKFVSEVYYKYLYDLVPFEFDNVLIRYFGENRARGYAAGIDFRLHGELVEGAESWISMSIMSTKEDISDDFYYQYFDAEGNRVFRGSVSPDDIADSSIIYPGFIPRPTDQRVSFNLFFQDYLPKNENFKVHLNLIFGTGLPFGPPDKERYNDLLRIPFYRRVDIGFSAQLFDKNRKKNTPPKNIVRHFESIWATLEIYNLLGVNNTVSYLWVKDIRNTVYAVPNFLTNRRINLRMIFKF